MYVYASIYRYRYIQKPRTKDCSYNILACYAARLIYAELSTSFDMLSLIFTFNEIAVNLFYNARERKAFFHYKLKKKTSTIFLHRTFINVVLLNYILEEILWGKRV